MNTDLQKAEYLARLTKVEEGEEPPTLADKVKATIQLYALSTNDPLVKLRITGDAATIGTQVAIGKEVAEISKKNIEGDIGKNTFEGASAAFDRIKYTLRKEGNRKIRGPEKGWLEQIKRVVEANSTKTRAPAMLGVINHLLKGGRRRFLTSRNVCQGVGHGRNGSRVRNGAEYNTSRKEGEWT